MLNAQVNALTLENARLAGENARRNTPCVWRYDAYDCFYETACGETWQFEAGTAEDNDVHFCHNCGHPILVFMPETSPDAEEE